MVSLVIKNPNLPSGYNIVSTTWQLATSKDFIQSSIVVESIENTVNKLNIQFDIELQLGVKYYARCRVIYNKGFSNYSNINVFTARDLNEIELDVAAPTKISRPSISILPNMVEKPISLLEFKGGDFTTKYNIAQESASWILEDINGKVVWDRINDSVNLNSIKLPIALKENSAYRLLVSYRGKNNNESQFAVKTFITGTNQVALKGNLKSIPAGVDLTFNIDINDAALSSVVYELYAEGGNLVSNRTILASEGIDMTRWSVSGSLILRDVDYMLYVKTVSASLLVEETGYFYFKPYFNLLETPDVNFKYINDVFSFVPSYTPAMFATATGYRPELPNGELIQSSGTNGTVVLNFFAFDYNTKRFNFTGRSFNLGQIFGVGSVLSMDDFSYILTKSGKLIIKCLNDDMIISIPYNVISGDLNINLLKTKKFSAGLVSKAENTHGIIDINDNEFITFSTLDSRLIVVNSNDLSYSFLNSKLYATAPLNVSVYKLSSSLMMIMTATSATEGKYDIYDYKNNRYIVQDVVIATTGIVLLNNGYNTTKVVQLFNGDIIMIFKSTVPTKSSYKLLKVDTELNTSSITSLIEKDGIDAGVYSMLRNGKALQLAASAGLIFE